VSETITIAIREVPDFIGTLDAISAALHINDLRSLEDVPAPGTPWPDGIRHVYRHGVSTRTTEITCSDGEFSIRMFSMASREDVALAVALAEYVAEHSGVATVSAETGGDMAPPELATYYTPEWADGQIESGFAMVSAMIRDGRGPMQIPGPQRSFFVGPRMLLQLAADRPEQRLLDAIRYVQWIPIRTAGVFEAKSATTEKPLKLATWLGEEVVFPGVDYACLGLDSSNVFLIPASRVAELAGEHWTPIDEVQGIIADCGDDWPAIVEAARKYATKP
jgi:hypothetical protein